MTPDAAPIWHGDARLEPVREYSRGTLSHHCGIELTELGRDYIRGTMPVQKTLTQPMGLLHGGASMVLAETLGSIGASLVIDREKFMCVGQEINANHLLAAYPGDVITGTARPIHIGSRSQVWGIELRDQRGRLTCISRLTMAVIARRDRPPASGDAAASGPAQGAAAK